MNRHWGVLCLAYPEVRSHLIRRFKRLLTAGNFDGLFVCLRSQSRPADVADQFGFNRSVRDEFLSRYGKDIWAEDFDLSRWRDLLGEYLTVFITELKKSLNKLNLLLARQWHQRSPNKERDLLGHPCVEGLVFSSFRHDNPGPIRRNDWTVTHPSSDT